MASTPISHTALSQALASFGLEDTIDNREQLAVMVESLQVYEEREATRGGLWKEAGFRDSAHHLMSKARRLMHGSDLRRGDPRNYLDEALDAVNYAAFWVRNMRAGRVGD